MNEKVPQDNRLREADPAHRYGKKHKKRFAVRQYWDGPKLTYRCWRIPFGVRSGVL